MLLLNVCTYPFGNHHGLERPLVHLFLFFFTLNFWPTLVMWRGMKLSCHGSVPSLWINLSLPRYHSLVYHIERYCTYIRYLKESLVFLEKIHVRVFRGDRFHKARAQKEEGNDSAILKQRFYCRWPVIFLRVSNFRYLIVICRPIAKNMREPRRLTTLWASAACYRDSWLRISLRTNLVLTVTFWNSVFFCNATKRETLSDISTASYTSSYDQWPLFRGKNIIHVPIVVFLLGHVSLRVVNGTWVDLDSLTFILHFLNQFWIATGLVCETMAGSLSVATTALSSANVAVVDSVRLASLQCIAGIIMALTTMKD
jgi:hypothetical protein